MDRSVERAFDAWRTADLDEQRRRLRTVPIDQRLREVLAWSAVAMADALDRSDDPARLATPDPVGLGSLWR